MHTFIDPTSIVHRKRKLIHPHAISPLDHWISKILRMLEVARLVCLALFFHGCLYNCNVHTAVGELIADPVQRFSPHLNESDFGSFLALNSESTAVVGAHSGNGNIGAAYLYAQIEFSSSWPNSTFSTIDGSLISQYASAHSSGVANWDVIANSNYTTLLGAKVWTQLAILTASDPSSGSNFGFSGSIAKDMTLISSYTNDCVYVFSKSSSSGSLSNTWSQQAKLVASDSVNGDNFGASVEMNTKGELSQEGSFLAIGAYNADSAKGKVYTFSLDSSASSWSQQAILQASDASSADLFGSHLCANGNMLAVSSIGKEGGAGVVYTFSSSSLSPAGVTWSQQAILRSNVRSPGDHFGSSISFQESIGMLAIGARSVKTSNIPYGAVYLFSSSSPRTDSSWIFEMKLEQPSTGYRFQYFGYSMDSIIYPSTSQPALIIGAYDQSSVDGGVYIFQRSLQNGVSLVWSQQEVLQAADSSFTAGYGRGAAFSSDGTNMLVSSYKSGNNGCLYTYRDENRIAILSALSPEESIYGLSLEGIIICLALCVLASFYVSHTLRKERHATHAATEDDGLDVEEQERYNRGILIMNTSATTPRTPRARFPRNIPEESPRVEITVKSPNANSPRKPPKPNKPNTMDKTSILEGKFLKEMDPVDGVTQALVSAANMVNNAKVDESNPHLIHSKKNIINFQARDFFIDFNIAALTSTTSYCFFYILAVRGGESLAALLACTIFFAVLLPWAVLFIDMSYPKYFSRSFSMGIGLHHLKPYFGVYYIVFLSSFFFSLNLIRFLPWRQSQFSVISRGFPTHGVFNLCIYSEFTLCFVLILTSIIALYSDSLNMTLSSKEMDTYLWIAYMNLFLTTLKVIYNMIHFAIPVWYRKKSMTIKLLDSPKVGSKSFEIDENLLIDGDDEEAALVNRSHTAPEGNSTEEDENGYVTQEDLEAGKVRISNKTTRKSHADSSQENNSDKIKDRNIRRERRKSREERQLTESYNEEDPGMAYKAKGRKNSSKRRMSLSKKNLEQIQEHIHVSEYSPSAFVADIELSNVKTTRRNSKLYTADDNVSMSESIKTDTLSSSIKTENLSFKGPQKPPLKPFKPAIPSRNIGHLELNNSKVVSFRNSFDEGQLTDRGSIAEVTQFSEADFLDSPRPDAGEDDSKFDAGTTDKLASSDGSRQLRRHNSDKTINSEYTALTEAQTMSTSTYSRKKKRPLIPKLDLSGIINKQSNTIKNDHKALKKGIQYGSAVAAELPPLTELRTKSLPQVEMPNGMLAFIRNANNNTEVESSSDDSFDDSNIKIRKA